MPILHAYTTPGVFWPAVPFGLRMMYSVQAAAASSASDIPMPAPGVLAELGVRWANVAPVFNARVHVLIDGVIVKTVPIVGVSGFAVDPTVVPFVAGQSVGFLLDVTAGFIGGLGGTVVQAAVVARPAAGAPTHARVQLGFAPGDFYLSGPGGHDRETVDAGWLSGGSPILTGLLVPVPVTVTRFVADNTTNTLNASVSIRLWDTLGGVDSGVGPITFAPAEVAFKDLGPISVPVSAGKVLVVRGDTAAILGSMSGPVRATALLDIPA